MRTQTLTVSMIWHARTDGDEAHRWLRACLLQIAAADPGGRGAPRLRVAARTQAGSTAVSPAGLAPTRCRQRR